MRSRTSRHPRHRLASARAARLYRVGPLPIRGQQRPDLRRRLRRAEQITLHLGTASVARMSGATSGVLVYPRISLRSCGLLASAPRRDDDTGEAGMRHDNHGARRRLSAPPP